MSKTLTVVGLHGFVCDNVSSTSFTKAIVEAAALNDIAVSIFAPDLPGHGTQPIGDVKNIEDFAEFIHGKITENVVGPYILMGFSMGGMIALKYAEMYESDNNLLGIGVWASPILPLEVSLTPLFKSWAQKFLLDLIPDPLFNKAKTNKIVIDFMRKMELNVVPMERKGLKQVINALALSKFYFNSLIPKCFVYGVLDPLVTVDNFTYLQDTKPLKTQAYLFNSAGHFGTKGGRALAHNAFGMYIRNLIADSSVFAADLTAK
jgi:pimeloyl-ACP methyl ester carboxylesterase